jgi:hypothetical protein
MKKEGIILMLLSLTTMAFLLCLSCTPTESLKDQGISILSPKANDVVQAGAPYEIQWKAEVPDTEFGVKVTIEVSKDGGKSWENVEENVPNSGKYSWKVPRLDSTQCKVRIFSQYKPKYRRTSETFTVK